MGTSTRTEGFVSAAFGTGETTTERSMSDHNIQLRSLERLSMSTSTRLVVYVSLVASAAIAAAKFTAYLATGNASMLSQTYYSLSDVGNQVLLLVGFRLSEAGASRKHPFGRGKEQFFFAFVVTVSSSGSRALPRSVRDTLRWEPRYRRGTFGSTTSC